MAAELAKLARQFGILGERDLEQIVRGTSSIAKSRGYESFPELNDYLQDAERFSLEIGGKSLSEYKKQIKRKDMQIRDDMKEMLALTEATFSDTPQTLDLIKVHPYYFGFNKNPSYDQIIGMAKESGLMLCPPEVGLAIRLFDENQENNTKYAIAMDPIPDSDSFFCSDIFGLERNAGYMRLIRNDVFENDSWSLHSTFVFQVPPKNEPGINEMFS